jgi:hypothetical protein
MHSEKEKRVKSNITTSKINVSKEGLRMGD